ncbi:hypothetical protein GSMA_04691 [Serratia marcescens subsp. marcescens ATCC 13880]|jgi:hypothetical protein|nr:Hypothetical protein SmN45_1003 [Serratia marcescens]KFD10522.1 hypothetical protein GSMA_04691 [Serratia marcescens subsp. marcescens ATCC 13880]
MGRARGPSFFPTHHKQANHLGHAPFLHFFDAMRTKSVRII